MAYGMLQKEPAFNGIRHASTETKKYQQYTEECRICQYRLKSCQDSTFLEEAIRSIIMTVTKQREANGFTGNGNGIC
ncbi:MAG: hypothetical protein LUF30_01000, partial [Lachnospiraceae bacterium]|nr:hypothetical protein [Lachnospiraceae bacterium]